MRKDNHSCNTGMSRRGFLRNSALVTAAVGIGGFAGARPGFAAGYPSRDINIIIPTGEGGGADRDARVFTKIWGNHLKTNFNFRYYPGAAGEVGYRFFMSSEPDCYNLLFANLGPEVIMLELQKTGIEVGRDIVYVEQTLSEPMNVWVGANSPIKSLEDLIDTAKKRTVTCAVSRLPHPASIGMLAMGEATGANFTLVPYGGGNPSAMAAITGEADCCALPLTNSIVLGDQVRVLGVFANKNVVPGSTDNAPPVNQALGTNIPPMISSRAWGLQGAAVEAYPDQVKILADSMQATLQDPAYANAVEAAGVPASFIDPGDREIAMASAQQFADMAKKYRDLLTGKK
ncbi:tripartite tricarboxylate transporter substrate-binding protein [Hoeflea sp. G2-23]|uniref:Tripartite tricarboxylate transporter substrate-binding protein n=1 Tax=Hoeflea algicola TaxID=2983763 RepID=A0ABT3Z939_9HYPH|nr:tripartite tricarboxylate transporter substrate-binding protein [Hoeflea algicola]MCY0148173.1 tripartite tricarboxylate transporter substrate-binding protein [Hoeflea algicola]